MKGRWHDSYMYIVGGKPVGSLVNMGEGVWHAYGTTPRGAEWSHWIYGKTTLEEAKADCETIIRDAGWKIGDRNDDKHSS